MNTKCYIKLLALFALVVFTNSLEKETNLRILEESKEVPKENTDINEPKRELSEVTVENKQENENLNQEANEAMGEAQKDSEGRLLSCKGLGSTCTSNIVCCTGVCRGKFCLNS